MLAVTWPPSALAGGIAVTDAYARATIAGVKTGAVYLRITNSGDPDRLRAASTDVAARAELHRHTEENGVMFMAEVKCLVIPAGETVAFEPGSLHVMLFGVKAPLIEGSEIALTFRFEKAGEVTVQVPVRGIAAGSGKGSHGSHRGEICD